LSQNTPHDLLEKLEETAASIHTDTGPASRMVWRQWGSGRPLVLLHGGAGSWMHWARNIGPLANQRSVWVPDMPGFADSDLPREGLDADSIAELVLAGLTSLLGDQPFDLAGFSFGALVASFIAARAPRGPERLVLVSAAGLGLLNVMPPIRPVMRVSNPLSRREVLRANLQSMMLHDPASIDDTAVTIQERSATRERVKNRKLVHTDIMRTLSPLWRCRSLGIWSQQDALYAHQFDRLQARVAEIGLTRSVFLDQGGHWLPYEQSDTINRLIAEFLS
jgi:pimeloyl-ACP methyl ester carboxylesterase